MSVGSHGTASLLFMRKVMVWHFVSDCHKVMIALAVILPSNCCCFCGESLEFQGFFIHLASLNRKFELMSASLGPGCYMFG